MESLSNLLLRIIWVRAGSISLLMRCRTGYGHSRVATLRLNPDPEKEMYPPVTSPFVALMVLMLVVVFALLEIGIIETAYSKLGVSHRAISVLLFATLVGSYLNIPIATVHAHNMMQQDQIVTAFGIAHIVPHASYPHETV